MGERGLEGGDAVEEGMNERMTLIVIELLLLLLIMKRRKAWITTVMILEEGMQGWKVLLLLLLLLLLLMMMLLLGFEGLMGVKRGKGRELGLGMEEELGGERLEEVIRCGERGWWRSVGQAAVAAAAAAAAAAATLTSLAVVVVVRGRHQG